MTLGGTAKGALLQPERGHRHQRERLRTDPEGADAAKYLLVPTSTTADITPAPLTVSGITANNKVYDGSTTATFDTSTQALKGVVPTDVGNVSWGAPRRALLPSPNVGTYTINVTGLTISGTSMSNYTLTQPTSTANITAATVSGSFTASDKVYDGGLSATILRPYDHSLVSLETTLSPWLAGRRVSPTRTSTWWARPRR